MTGSKGHYTRAELAERAAGLRLLLDKLGSGELTAPADVVIRLEGAWLALETLAAGRWLSLDELLGTP
jgi:hypothetical protein